MKEYRVIRHAEECEERKDHKYFARVKLKRAKGKKGNNYRYFYTKAEYQAYLKGEKETKEDKVKTTSGVKDRGMANITQIKPSDKLEKIEKKDLSSTINRGFSAVAKVLKNISDTVIDAIELTSKQITKVAQTITKIVDYSVDELIDNIQDVFDKEPPESGLEPEGEDILEEDILTEEILYEDILTEDVLEEEPPYLAHLPKKDEEWTKDEDQAAVNPNYDPDEMEYSYNCAYCTTAYDMRRRGYDVEAEAFDPYSYEGENSDIESWYVDAPPFRSFQDIARERGTYTFTYDEASEIMEEELLQYGEGAYGHFGLWWSGGGGHAVVWEIENGDVVIRDAQTNEIHDIEYYLPYISNMDYLRTDNLELSQRALRCVKDRKKKE